MHVLGVTETWLINSIPDAAVSIPNCVFYRNDVSGLVHKHGVGIYVHNSYKCFNMNINIPNTCSVFLPDLKLHIVVVYRPSYSLHDNNILIDFLSDFCINREVIVMGDFKPRKLFVPHQVFLTNHVIINHLAILQIDKRTVGTIIKR